MQGFRIFILAMVSIVVVLLGVASFYTWSMADFDCFDGYFECRRNWWGESGIVVGVAALAWVTTLIWFFNTRKK